MKGKRYLIIKGVHLKELHTVKSTSNAVRVAYLKGDNKIISPFRTDRH